MNRCTKCNEVKTSDGFYKNRRKKNGLESICKTCICSSKKARREQRARIISIRNNTSTRVLNVEDCTFEERQIIRPINKDLRLNDLIEELVWERKERGLVE